MSPSELLQKYGGTEKTARSAELQLFWQQSFASLPERDLFKKPVRYGREIFYSLLGASVTALACVCVMFSAATLASQALSAGKAGMAVYAGAMAVFFGFLVYGNLIYLINRAAYFHRLRKHNPVSQLRMEAIYDAPSKAPTITYLIPSYKEEPQVIRQSVYSAFLQDYPHRRVVLLLDDPVNTSELDDLMGLLGAQKIMAEVRAAVREPAELFENAQRMYLERRANGESELGMELLRLFDLHATAAERFEKIAADFQVTDHADRHFLYLTFAERIQDHRRRAHEFFLQGTGFGKKDASIPVEREFERLASLFRAEVMVFQRKRYANLSWAPNKAMNLNSYIGLMGGRFREVASGKQILLQECPPGQRADLEAPDTDYIVNLDADSTLSTDYTLRLVHAMEKPENSRVAVMQTPYTSIPNAPGLLERVAGATTDMQFLVSQGFTAFNSSSWVGANSLLRKAAIDEIVTYTQERGYTIPKYIQDRTVIEDTESTIDLIERGWKLHAYPERLSYSATPPDFGSLVVQRARWANGGLILLPKLLRYLAKQPATPLKISEAFLRFHYLTQAVTASLGYLIILTIPLKDFLRIAWWLPLIGLPYYAVYLHDLKQAGYQRRDCLRAYALNFILIPINVAGVFKSIQQIITGKQIPFKRTPKVPGRTPAQASFVIVEHLLFLYCIVLAVVSLTIGNWLDALFPVLHSFVFLYAIRAFIGFRNSLEDVRLLGKGQSS